MKINCSRILAAAALGLGLGLNSAHAAAPTTAQKLITGKSFTGLTGTAIANLTNSAKFPNDPDAIYFFPYFEWVATGDITTPPANFADNYGGQIVGYFHPPATGDYIFWLAADDNAVLYLSTDADPANKKLIAQETAWSNFREYTTSGGNSTLTSKDSSQFATTQWATKDPAGGAKITLQSGRAYYIEALFKEGGGGDNLSVAVQDPGFTIDGASPIPGNYLSTDRTFGPATITSQPQSQSVPERGSVSFRVLADGTPPYTYQWKKNGVDIAGETNLALNLASAAVADNGAKYSVAVAGAQGSVTSQEALLTVVPDTQPPTVIGAKGSPNLTELVLTFSEAVTKATAEAVANYQLSSASGSLGVTAASLSGSGTSVTLTTAKQTLGTKYTILVSNIRDSAATPNTIAANSKAVFFPTGKLVEQNGFIVFEAENYDRNSDGIWVRDTTRGNPSGGASVVAPNGAGGNESSKLEYDVEFKQAATYKIWYRASGNDGSDDSSWFHLNGERPAERVDGNSAAMTGFSGALDFVWRTDSFGGVDPMSVDIAAPGVYAVGLARREDGSFFDKFILTTDMAFNPTGFGPPETREGAPKLPTATLTAPTDGQTFASGANVTLTPNASGDMGLAIVRVEYSANGNAIGESTSSPFSFTWSNVPNGIYALRARAIDEINQSTTSAAVTVTVGTPPPQALLVVGTDSDPVLNASDAGVKARLESKGWQVAVVQAPASTTANGDGKQLIIVSSTVNSGDVGTKFRNSAAPVLVWEQAVQDDFLMTGNTDTVERGTLAGQTQVNIIKSDHPLAGGLTTGVKVTTTAAQDYSWGAPNQNAVIIGTVADDQTRSLIYGYEKGAMLIDGTTPAPARRVLFFWGNNGFAASTDDTLKLFDAAVAWASNITPKPATPTLSVARAGAALTISFTGTLQSSDAVTGPWTDVANAASPLSVTPAGGQKFYRAKQ